MYSFIQDHIVRSARLVKWNLKQAACLIQMTSIVTSVNS